MKKNLVRYYFYNIIYDIQFDIELLDKKNKRLLKFV